MITQRTTFEDICLHVENNIIGQRRDFQPYGAFLGPDGIYYAAPLWWIQDRGFRVLRVWRSKQ
jgi:hypothetical protein